MRGIETGTGQASPEAWPRWRRGLRVVVGCGRTVVKSIRQAVEIGARRREADEFGDIEAGGITGSGASRSESMDDWPVPGLRGSLDDVEKCPERNEWKRARGRRLPEWGSAAAKPGADAIPSQRAAHGGWRTSGKP